MFPNALEAELRLTNMILMLLVGVIFLHAVLVSLWLSRISNILKNWPPPTATDDDDDEPDGGDEPATTGAKDRSLEL